MTTLLALWGAAWARDLEVIDSDPTILRYYRDCGRNDVVPLDALSPDAPGFDAALARWQHDAEALESMLLRYGIQMVNAAIDARVDDRTCLRVDFAVGVGTALTARHFLWPSSATVDETRDDLEAVPPPVERWRRPAWAWIAGAGGLAAVGAGSVVTFLAHDGAAEAGDALASARASQDELGRGVAGERIRDARTLEIAGAAGAGVGLGVAVLAWTVRW